MGLVSTDAFSTVRDSYEILKLSLSEFLPTTRQLPEGYRIGPCDLSGSLRARERELLELNFTNWRGPFDRRTPGWRGQTPVYLLHGEELVGAVYLCGEHEFEEASGWGQLHYFFVDPAHKGKGLHSILFAESVRRAASWGLRGVYINTDRHGLPELYQRWGARPWKSIPKSNGPVAGNSATGQMLADELWQAIRRYARGALVEIGCTSTRYAMLTRGLATSHVCVGDTRPAIAAGIVLAVEQRLSDEDLRWISRVLDRDGFAILAGAPELAARLGACRLQAVSRVNLWGPCVRLAASLDCHRVARWIHRHGLDVQRRFPARTLTVARPYAVGQVTATTQPIPDTTPEVAGR